MPYTQSWKECAETALEAQQAGNMPCAEEHYRLSVNMARALRGNVHEDVGEALINLADFCVSAGRLIEAEVAYDEALTVYESLFGKDSLVAAMIYRVLAEIYIKQHRQHHARLLQAKAKAIFGQRCAKGN
jgi:hypothetical protein